MRLIQQLETAIGGYWDGGLKRSFQWTIDSPPLRDSKGRYVKVGSYEANHWFYVALGKNQKQTLANARRKLTARMKRDQINGTFSYVRG